MSDDSPGLEVENRITAFLTRELLSPEATVTRDDDLLSGELLDSIGVLRLATFVEEEFQIKIQPADLIIENFQNVAVLAEFVRRATGRGAPPPTDARR